MKFNKNGGGYLQDNDSDWQTLGLHRKARAAKMSFQEVLQKSIDQNCDFLLLGGDLFHEHNPSKYTFDIFDRHIIG